MEIVSIVMDSPADSAIINIHNTGTGVITITSATSTYPGLYSFSAFPVTINPGQVGNFIIFSDDSGDLTGYYVDFEWTCGLDAHDPISLPLEPYP